MRIRFSSALLPVSLLLCAACASGPSPNQGAVAAPKTGPRATSSNRSAAPPGSPSRAATARPQTLQEAQRIVTPAVVRFDVTGCDGASSGTGFLVGKDLVVTAAHVVAGGPRGRVTSISRTSSFEVAGIDAARDVALVRTSRPMGQVTVNFAKEPAAVGDPVATVGYSLGGNVSFHAGIVNGLDRKVEIEGRTAFGLIEHSAEALPGDSGAPLIDRQGSVTGIHGAGIPGQAGQRLAVPASIAAPLVQKWRRRTADIQPMECSFLFDADGDEIDTSEFAEATPEAWDTLVVYVEAMNRADWTAAAAQFADGMKPAVLNEGARTSQIKGLTLRDMSVDNGTPLAWAEFDSTQEAGQGPAGRRDETCTSWSLDYTFSKKNGLWLIKAVRGHDGGEPSRPCQ